ncbi:LysR family transcriptional regulator [Cardiobacteriaceae bacterium TAE3-ERU3]|nr:LysR family transcriptional regulator [Cardiobacteriaceae bacterium TAE3-ERU3]
MQELSFRKYPSTASLQCFEASARHLSFTKAARELHMTQSAVSKQVAQLENLLQTQLFHRSRQRLHLSPAGKIFLKEAEAILARIELAVLNMLAHGSEAEPLHIACHPTLCARWLVPLLKGFSRAHPHIHLDICDQIGTLVAENRTVDMAFLYGDGVWPEMECIKLFDEHCVAVCAPSLIDAPLANVEALADYTLLQSRSRPRAWRDYFALQLVQQSHTFTGPRFDTFYACIQAAETGCGIALVPQLLVQDELDSGKLIMPWPYVLHSSGAYYMLYATALADTPKVAAMLAWVQKHLHD